VAVTMVHMNRVRGLTHKPAQLVDAFHRCSFFRPSF
jgi:hypothetical protein